MVYTVILQKLGILKNSVLVPKYRNRHFGTSLTKCYQILDRFSEDIDLSYAAASGIPGESRKRQLKKAVISTMDELGFLISNLDNTRSRRYYNCYRAAYPSIYEHNKFLKQELVIETYVALLPFPTTTKMADNYLYRFLCKIKRPDIAEKYDLLPFPITTQTLERTLIDKIFAVCDYYIEGKVARHSRHLYDIYKIIDSIGLPDSLEKLIPEVRTARSELSICPSAKPDIDISAVLQDIIESKAYHSDYNDITLGLLFIPESYDTVINGLREIANSRIFH